MACRMSPFHSIARSPSPASSRSWPLSGAKAVMFGFCLMTISSAAAMFSSVQSFSDLPISLSAEPKTFWPSDSMAMRPAYLSEV